MHLAIKNGQTPNWVAVAFTQSGIPMNDLLEQVYEFTESQATFWNNPENRSFLFEVFAALAAKALDRSHSVIETFQQKIETILQSAGSLPVAAKMRLLKERINSSQ